MKHTLHVRGSQPGAEPRQPFIPADRPDFFGDLRRPCAPHKGNDHLFVSDDKAERTKATRLCGRCPFRAECLAWAVQIQEKNYVWGGVDLTKTTERRKVYAGVAA